jgi:phage protein D
MNMTLSDGAVKLIRKNQKLSLEVDAETHRLMCELAQNAGSDIPTLLSKLAQRYNRANWFEKQAVIHFLNGV